MRLGRASRSSLLPLLLGLCLTGAAPPVGSGPADPVGPSSGDVAAGDAPGYHLAEGSIARRRIVALGEDLVIAGEAMSHAVVLGGSATIQGQVGGDLIVLGGDVDLAASARVEGDVYVLGGRIAARPGAVLGGRSVAYADASTLWLALLQGPALGAPAFSPVIVGSKLALLAFWAFVILLAMGLAKGGILRTSESVRREPFRNFTLGLTGVLAMVLTAGLFSELTSSVVGVPLLVLVLVIALGLRFWGMIAVFHALGEWLCRVFHRRPPSPEAAAAYGLMALGLLKLLPWIGIWSWTLATFMGVGAALATRLGQRDVWYRA